MWNSQELRITREQAECLLRGQSTHWSEKFAERTELSLEERGMLAWLSIGNGQYRPGPNAKGRAALAQFQEFLRNSGGIPLPSGAMVTYANDNNSAKKEITS